MIELSLKTGFSRMERALQTLARDQVPFAAARSLNDVARSASVRVNAGMATVFDRPTAFTDRAAVAPISLAAQKDRLSAVVTLRPIQARYLLREEIGGTRSPADNTRRPDATALVLPGRGLALDAHGNIPAGTLRRLKQEAKPAGQRRRKAKALKAGIAIPAETVVFLPATARAANNVGGYFRRLAGHRLTRLTGFEAQTHYTTPRLGYRDRVAAVARSEWTSAFRRRLLEAMRTAR